MPVAHLFKSPIPIENDGESYAIQVLSFGSAFFNTLLWRQLLDCFIVVNIFLTRMHSSSMRTARLQHSPGGEGREVLTPPPHTHLVRRSILGGTPPLHRCMLGYTWSMVGGGTPVRREDLPVTFVLRVVGSVGIYVVTEDFVKQGGLSAKDTCHQLCRFLTEGDRCCHLDSRTLGKT